MPQNKTPPRQSIWQPLANKLFLAVWSATLVSNTGTWMNDLGAAWLMASTTASPVMVALVQTATSLPIMLLAIPAGALADIVDRRRYLLATQIWMFASASGLLFCTLSGLTTGWVLVVFTFLLGCGTAMSMPAWSAVTPELVAQKELHAAITLNGLGVNISRAIGPAVAGYLIALYGVPSVFLANTLSFLGVIAVIACWKRTPNESGLPAERCLGAMRSGLRYARYSSLLPAILIRGVGFFPFASALWALLPILVKQRLHASSSVYGLLMAGIGLGAITIAIALPRIRQRIRSDNLVRLATLAYGGASAILATQDDLYVLLPAMGLAGAAWICVMSSLQVAAQGSLPDWVRARGLSVFMMVFMGGMAGGSLLWGFLAKRYGIETSFLTAAAGLIVSILLTWRYRIGDHDDIDFTPSMHWPLPMVDQTPEHDKGPVLVTIEYTVAGGRLDEFYELSHQLKKIRKRDGAYFWELFQDTAKADRYIECFMVESWLEHLRQHERVSVSDRVLEDRIGACLAVGESKKINHYVAPGYAKKAKRNLKR
ncbi:MFS transporter [Methylomicrobium sp. RS1]|nr:MFS transporter [Methylomicrobium sp. RS1]